MTEMDSSERQLENLAKVLEAAQELRHLSFGILNWRYLNELMWGGTSIPEGRSTVDLIGLGATWPKLRSLKLEGIYARERDLCELIDRHKDTLRTLTFARSTLHAGLWIEVVNEVVFNASMITTFVLDQVDENHGGYGTGTNGSLEGYEGRLIVTEGGEREFVRSNPIFGLCFVLLIMLMYRSTPTQTSTRFTTPATTQQTQYDQRLDQLFTHHYANQ